MVDILFKENTTMTQPGSKVKQMALISLMTAIICVLAPISLTLPTSPVPISPANMVICFTVMILGMKRGTLSVLIYILLGLAGLPVFSYFTGGIGKLLGPTGGYIMGYLFLSLILGLFAERFKNKPIPSIIGALLGTICLYAFGTVWMMLQLEISLTTALWTGVLPYIPADLIKIIAAILMGNRLRKRLTQSGLI